MSKTLKAKTMTVQRDEEGPFVRWNGRVFRADPQLRKETSFNRETRRAMVAMGIPNISPLDYRPLDAGDKVVVSIESLRGPDSIGVFTALDPDGPGTRLAWPEGVGEGFGNFVNWSDEAAPLRPGLDDDGDGPALPPAPRR